MFRLIKDINGVIFKRKNLIYGKITKIRLDKKWLKEGIITKLIQNI
jgi:hypothetical protein